MQIKTTVNYPPLPVRTAMIINIENNNCYGCGKICALFVEM
jgi:hypothetical protein